jgi:ribosomal protein L30E
MFGKGTQKEGFLVEKVVDFNDKGEPIDRLIDEYNNPLTDGYYFSPIIASGKWDTGTKDYKQYTLKSLPYGYEASKDKKSITPKTNVAALNQDKKTPSVVDNFPEWREWSFAEYTQVTSTPIKGYVYGPGKTGAEAPLKPGNFKINKKQGSVDKYEFAPIPMNHRLLGPDALNPMQTYLTYTGSYQDIAGYSYSALNTGQYEVGSTTTIKAPQSGKYKIKLVSEYNLADNTEKKVKYVVADIPVGYELDSADPSFTKLLSKIAKYDANNTDIQYNEVTDPPKGDDKKDDQTLEAGIYYQFDKDGKIVEVQYKDSNFAPVLYYMPGAYKFGSSAYVPTYEDSVYLSRSTRNAQLMPGASAEGGNGPAPVFNTNSQLGGFCEANKNDKQKIEEKCMAIEKGACASTSCCVLLGGEKCVAGNENGPHMTANYTDYALATRNRDFYYYQGKCYGNCAKN